MSTNHTYDTVGSASDTQWVDTTGNYAAQQGNLNNYISQYSSGFNNAANYQQQYDPNAAYNQFMGQSEGLANMAQGATAPLTQSLNAVASRESALGSEAALAAMPGSASSGAGMAAFGQAYADPFAKAQSQIQSKQLDLTGSLWGQAFSGAQSAEQQQQSLASQNNQANLNAYGSLLNSLYGQQTSMAQGQGEIWSPQYSQNKNFWDYAVPAATTTAGYLTGKKG